MAALYVEDIVVDEGDGTINIVVRLTEAATQAVSVNYITANGSASGGFDVTGVSGTLNFAIGEVSKIVQVQILNDTLAENLEHFRFNLSTPVNATIAKASAMVSIVDNDTVVATPGLFVRDVVVDEKAGTASFVVMMGGPKGQAGNSTVTVDYATSNGTATAGSDYTAVSGTLTFAAGETVKTVTVNITDDASVEGFERFGLNLSNASGATILDGHADAIIGASDASAVALPSISVSDMVASEADGYVDIVVRLSAPGQNPVAVNYATANGTASGGFDVTGVSGTLNFALGETTKVVRVELLNDAVAENLEYFAFNLSTPVNATIAEASAMISIVDNDTVVATPGLFVRDVVVDEKAGTASFVVMLGGPKGQVSNSTVTVDYATGNSTSNATAAAGSDYTAVSGALTFASGETVKTVVVDITDDALAEGQERFNLNLSNAVGATILDGQGVGLIGANDAAAVALPRISVSDMVASEADGYVDIVVSLSAPGQNPVSVNYTTVNGTASGGFDYTGASGTLNFALGETTKVVRVELLNDAVAENLEYFAFNLSTPVNATIAEASAMISIVDNDTVVATPGLFVRDVVVDEKAGTASFVVMLGGPKGQVSNSTVTVDYATGNSTSNATAAAGSDYTAVSGALTFASGETVKTVVVDITDDALAEGQERFNLNLSNAVGATILDGQGVGLIGANDAVAVAQPTISVSDMVASEADGYVDIVVSLSAPGQNPVSVNYTTVNGTASGGFDYTGASGTLNFALGETTKVVRVELLNDAVAENLEHFRFNLSTPVNATIAKASAMISIVDNDTVVATPGLFVRDVVVDEKAGTASFVVMLGGPKGQVSNSTVTVDYATGNSTSNATAAAGSDYTAVSGALTFASGETVKTVVVDITDDALAEGQERFNLNLSNAVGATILDGQGVGLIGANDAAAVALPRISVSDMVASEADGYVDIVVSLSAPGQNPVSVAYTTANGTASGGFDVTGASGTLNFALGETTKVVRVELLNDAVAENLEYFAFNLSTPVNATIAEASAMISIVDNDTVVDTPNLFVRDVVVDEKAGTASFVVMLGGPNSQSSNSVVTVNYATSNSTAAAGSDYMAVSGTLAFAAGETVKTVVVDIADDAVAEGLERFNLSLSNASNAIIKDGQAVAVIGANDATPVTTPLISVADIVVGESDGYVDIVLNLSAPGQSAVAVNYTTANATASGGFDYTGANGTLNFAVGETTKVVRVELLDNITVELLETLRFNLSSPVNATLANTFATISIVDNDTAGINVYSYGISDDIYNVSVTTDVIVENPAGGYDLVNASANYILPDQVDALVLVEGAGPLIGIGNGLANNLLGNSQNNMLIGGAGNDALDGGLGTDTADYTSAGGVLAELWRSLASNDGQGGSDTLISIENLTGSGFNDVLAGDDNSNVFKGGAGVDALYGGGGIDTADYSAATGGVFVELWKFFATNDGQGAADTLVDIENLTGSAFADILAGDNANNVFKGGAGNDAIFGGGGSDTADYSGATGGVFAELWRQSASNDGQGGADVLVDIENLTGSAFADTFAGDNNNNVFKGGAGVDALFGGGGSDTADYSGAGSGVFVELWKFFASNDGQGGADTLVDIENVNGSAFADTFAGDNNNNVFKGGAGVDAIFGGGGIDTADYSGAASGTFVELWRFFASNDGQGGADTLVDIENLTGSAFNDTFAGDNNNNVFKGGAGVDALFGGGGIDTISYADASSGVHVELWQFFANNDGQGGADTLVDMENVTGSAFADVLAGDNNANRLEGAGGTDVLYGGGGADSYAYGAGSGVDYIGDFIKAQGDKIHLQSNLNGSGITTGAQALAATVDVAGNAVVDLGLGNSITLVGVSTASLAAGDFSIV